MNISQPVLSAEQQAAPMPVLQAVVLVVDDSATNRIVIEKQLQKLACTVLTASDGTSALAIIDKGGLDLVLLDCQMPDISGYEVARRVRKKAGQVNDANARHLPLIAVSGDTDVAHRQLCFESGMDGVLGKPVKVAELRHLLALWCGVAEPTTVVPISKETSRIDLRSLYRSTAREDFEALRMSAMPADLYKIGRLAHRMKGAALAMHFADIVTTLEQIEALAFATDAPAGSLMAALEVLQAQLQAV